ncbi:MAG: DUF368 domain-containing protein [Bacilli bacterium]
MEELNTKTEIETKEDIPPHTFASWIKSALLGFIIGLAVIIPGVSGSQAAIIFKLYDKMIFSISNIFKRFTRCFLFLLPIILGGLIGFVVGFFGVKQLVAIAMFAFVALFAGMMIGSLPSITDEIKIDKVKPLHVILVIICLSIPIIMSVLSTTFLADYGSLIDNAPIWLYFVFIIIGILVSLTQLIPGLSATALLMQLGFFSKLMSSVSLTYIKTNPAFLGLLACLAVGFLVGLFFFSKLIAKIIEKNKPLAYIGALGFSLGSIVSMFYNPEIVQKVYNVWMSNSTSSSIYWELPTGIMLLIIGAVGAFAIILLSKKNKAN